MLPENGKEKDVINQSAITAKSKTVVANSVSLDPKNPIPLDYGADTFQVVFGTKYIPFLGFKDNMPNIFWESRLLSTTQNACISSIAQTCVGEGIHVKNVPEKDVDPDFLEWIKRINNDNQHINEVIRTTLDALQTDGNAWVEVVQGSFAGVAYVKIYLHTTMVCRLGIPDPKTGRIMNVVKSNQLAKPRNGMLGARSLKAVTFPLYSSNPIDKKTSWKKLSDDTNGDLHTMIHLKNEVPGVPYYGLPKSVASLRYQVLEGKAAQYNLDLFDNNMVLSSLLVFKGSMTQEEATENAREILKSHTGQGKQGRVGVISSEGGIEDFTYQPLQTEKEGSYLKFDERLEQKIVTSHGWDPVLAGINDGNSHPFSNGSQYVRAIFDVKKAMVLKPMSQYILDKLITPLVAIASEAFKKPEWKEYEIGLKHAMPFSLVSDILVNNVLTKDEGRKIIGFDPMEDQVKGKEIIGTRVTETDSAKTDPNNPNPKPVK